MTKVYTCTKDQWSIIENEFHPDFLGKSEVIMALGNGYMTVRSCTEENYLKQTRNTFIAGTFNKANSEEVTELPNLPDVIEMEIIINGRRFSLTEGKLHRYQKSLNLRSGELIRSMEWETEETGRVEMIFQRFVSHSDMHLLVEKVSIVSKTKPITIDIVSGINGRMTNSGAQHFIEKEKRFFNKKIMNLQAKTSESDIMVHVHTLYKTKVKSQEETPKMVVDMDRRQIKGQFHLATLVNEEVEITKFSMYATSRDLEFEAMSDQETQEFLNQQLYDYEKESYASLLSISEEALSKKLWNQVDLHIESDQEWDLCAARFAQYHLHIMMPAHDSRMGIGAKGMTGEGYKGHSFWDTEIFMFPYFLYTQPKLARQLLLYRHHTLDGARKKAKENGFLGAMFPWESAWATDGEVTPVWGACDIVSGKATKIWSGFIEQHITADIVYALKQYYTFTQDDEFMEKYGLEILIETAIFWASRIEKGEDEKYHINNVVGPDEYKEHVDDNAFTNYLVHLNFDLAIASVSKIEQLNRQVYEQFSKRYDLTKEVEVWKEKRDHLYLPGPEKEGVIPQDRTYLGKTIIDLTKYKNQSQVGSLFRDYNLDQVNEMQISKQADVMLLFYLLEGKFSQEITKANWDYYEPKTLHDSSLSLSTHAIIANDLGKQDLAYELYERCREIDLSQNRTSSDHGIHAASLGGMLQVIINGFGGVRWINNGLRIEPRLPKQWKRLRYPLHFQGDLLLIEIDHRMMTIENTTKRNQVIEFYAFGAKYLVREKISVSLMNQMQ